MALTREQFMELRGRGLSVDQIIKFKSGEKSQSAIQAPIEKPQSFLQKTGGFFKNIGNALTRSEQNLGKDIGRGILGGDKFQQGLINQYEDNAKRLLQLSAKQTDPSLKKKYEVMARGMFEDGKRAGEDFEGRTWKQIVGDVAGVALDVGLTLSGLGATKALKGAKTLSTGQKVFKGATIGAKYGTAYGAAGGMQEDKSALGIAGSAVVGGVGGAVLGGGLTLAGIGTGKVISTVKEKGFKGLLPQSENIMNRVARLTPNQANQFKKLARESHGAYLTRTGNFGTPQQIVEKEAVKFSNSLNQVDDALARLHGTHKSQYLDIVLNDLVKRETEIGIPSFQSNIISRLFQKNKTIGLEMKETNVVKRIYEQTIKLGYQKEQNAVGIARATRLDSALRNWQFQTARSLGLKNLDKLNKQTQLSKFIVDKLGNQIGGKTGNNAITLTDWIVLSGGDPTSISVFFAKKLLSSKGIQAGFAKAISNKPQGAITPSFEKFKQLGTPKGYVPGVSPRSAVGSGKAIFVAPKGSQTEFIKNGITSQTNRIGQPLIKSQSMQLGKKSSSININNISKEAINRGLTLNQLNNQLSSLSKDITTKEIKSMRKILNVTDFSKAKTTKDVAEIFIKQLPNNLKTAERIVFIRRISDDKGLFGSLIEYATKNSSNLKEILTNNPKSIKFYK